AYTLHINVKQRVPVVRVFEEEDNSYYLDSEGNILPLSNDYTHYSLVITGVPELRNDSTKEVLVAHLLKLAKTIQEDEFWNLQVSSVKMNSEGKFELVPVVGKHRILIGDTSRLEEKLSHIRAFYQQVLNRIGWEMYQTID